jgi:hypothetical protein
VLGGVALAARFMWSFEVAALQDVVVMMTMRGRFARAQLPMMKVCDFHCGTFDEICLLCGASHACSHCHSHGPRDISGRIHDLLEDCGVEFGQLAPALRCVRVAAWLQVVFGGN